MSNATPNPEEFKHALHLIDVAMHSVANTPLTVNNHDSLKACLSWLSEMKNNLATQAHECAHEHSTEAKAFV